MCINHMSNGEVSKCELGAFLQDVGWGSAES